MYQTAQRTLLLVNTQFACDENAVFWECCCISLHALLLTCTCYMKGCCFHNGKISLETSGFIKSVSPAGSVHVLTTSWKAAIINMRPCCVGLSDAWQERRRLSSASRPDSPPVCWSGIQSAALNSLPPNYPAQHLSQSFFLITKFSPNITYLCGQIFVFARASRHLNLVYSWLECE